MSLDCFYWNTVQVSIPERVWYRFRSNECLNKGRLVAKFQSLKGFGIDFDQVFKSHSLLGLLLFQSLKGFGIDFDFLSPRLNAAFF